MNHEGLQANRTVIDNIDAAILSLAAKRLGVVDQIASYKREHGLPVVDPEREAAQCERIETLADQAGVERAFAVRLWRVFVDESVEYQKCIMSDDT